jgi:predicted SPOUT superfamily RNA methylase MTH1
LWYRPKACTSVNAVENQKNEPISTERILIHAQMIMATTTTMGKP